jgi:hypothetical protein
MNCQHIYNSWNILTTVSARICTEVIGAIDLSLSQSRWDSAARELTAYPPAALRGMALFSVLVGGLSLALDKRPGARAIGWLVFGVGIVLSVFDLLRGIFG